MSESESKIRGLIQDLGGVWSRPFVTAGDPCKIDGAIIGLNPATPIATTEIPGNEFYRLIKDRPNFERFYTEVRQRAGKTGKSPTRKRLGIIINELSSLDFTETNVNSFGVSS